MEQDAKTFTGIRRLATLSDDRQYCRAFPTPRKRRLNYLRGYRWQRVAVSAGAFEFFQRRLEQPVRRAILALAAFDAAGDEHLPRACDSHIEQVQFFALGRGRFRLEQRLPCGAAIRLPAIKGEMARCGLFRWPIDDHIPGFAGTRCVVGAEQPDNRRFQPLGPVNRQDAHAASVGVVRFDLAFVRSIADLGIAQIAHFVDETG